MVQITNWQSLLNLAIDSYDQEHRTTSIVLNALNESTGEAFTSPLRRIRLTDVIFQLQRNAAFVGPGTVEARLYRVLAGTIVGTTAVPDIAGGVLASSDAVVAADIPLAWGLVNFHFPAPYTLEPELDYVIVIWVTNIPAGQVEVGTDTTTIVPPYFTKYSGNEADNLAAPPAWAPNPLVDVIFYLFSYSDVLAGGVVDVSDRAARQLGKVQLTDYTTDGIVFPHDQSIPVAPAKIVVASFNTLVGATAEGAAANLALSTNHRGAGTHSLEFDKVAGLDLAGVSYAVDPLDLCKYSTHAQVDFFIYVPTPVGGNITQVFAALGTDNANLFYWAIQAADLTLDAWNHVHLTMANVSGVFGVGADLSAIIFAAIYIQTSVVGATITNALVDQLVVKRTFEVFIAGVPEVQDTGVNTNPERWLHENHWEADEVTIAAAGVPGEQNLGAVVPAGATRRIRELTIRHAGTNNTVVTLLISGGATKVTLDIPAQTTRVWSSQDGREFDPTEQPTVQSSDITGGSTYVSASGVEV